MQCHFFCWGLGMTGLKGMKSRQRAMGTENSRDLSHCLYVNPRIVRYEHTTRLRDVIGAGSMTSLRWGSSSREGVRYAADGAPCCSVTNISRCPRDVLVAEEKFARIAKYLKNVSIFLSAFMFLFCLIRRYFRILMDPGKKERCR